MTDDETESLPLRGEGQARAAGQGGGPPVVQTRWNRTDKRQWRKAAADKSRAMRKQLTPHEALLWSWLKTLRTRGHHFRRQAPFRGYFLDFVSFPDRLVVELDGGGHMGGMQAEHDHVRDAVLAREGFRTLRIWNGELDADFEAVSLTILDALAAPHPAPLRAAVPPHGGGETR